MIPNCIECTIRIKLLNSFSSAGHASGLARYPSVKRPVCNPAFFTHLPMRLMRGPSSSKVISGELNSWSANFLQSITTARAPRAPPALMTGTRACSVVVSSKNTSSGSLTRNLSSRLANSCMPPIESIPSDIRGASVGRVEASHDRMEATSPVRVVRTSSSVISLAFRVPSARSSFPLSGFLAASSLSSSSSFIALASSAQE
mmetsp:Transcript_13844/g.20399  ORF Transcript_13844/g.20399 Transcript_13844/m.20399 type:complete len:202 (+) Transcript_13844:1109-1714(+)